MPKNQKVTVSSSNKESKIFVNNELQGKGTTTFKTKKDGVKQVVIQTPGYKDNYAVLTNYRRQPGFWVCVGGDALFLPVVYGYVGMMFDFSIPKAHAYEKDSKFGITGKINNKSAEDKYIDISKISADIQDKDVVVYNVQKSKKIQAKKLKS